LPGYTAERSVTRATLVESREYRVEVWMTFETKISEPFIVPI
jgi:hypothetical protein